MQAGIVNTSDAECAVFDASVDLISCASQNNRLRIMRFGFKVAASEVPYKTRRSLDPIA